MPPLTIRKLDFNDKQEINRVKDKIQELIKNKESYYALKVDNKATFKTLFRNPPEEDGWYIILNDESSLYTGNTKDLNNRINKQTDAFHSNDREINNKRNFIKKFIGKGIFEKPYICVISRKDLCTKLGLRTMPDFDRGNIEKVIDIFRGQLEFIHFDDI